MAEMQNVIHIRAANEGVSVPELIIRALNEHPTLNQAAESLGVTYRTLYRYMNEYGIARVSHYVHLEKQS